jgi:hypothetical protein
VPTPLRPGERVPDLPWETILGKGGPVALLALAVVSVIRGWLVPSTTVTLLMRRADDYQAAWQRSDEARALQAEQLTALLEYARTADAVLRSLPVPSQPREPA